MEQRYVPLRPSAPTPRRGDESLDTEHVKLKRRRASVTIACNACRRKKVRCDGRRPVCSNCDGQVTQCAYRDDVPLSQESKSLVIEMIRLFSSMPSAEVVAQVLQELKDEIDASIILTTLRSRLEIPSRSMDSSATTTEASSDTSKVPQELETQPSGESNSSGAFQTGDDLPCFRHLRSWRACVPSRSDEDALTETAEVVPTLSTILSFPPLPLDAYTSQSQTDAWTRTGWTKAHILYLFDVLFTWDILPLCLLSKDLFLRDYENGETEYCSSALVHATLALASRLINELDNVDALPSEWLGSTFFFKECQAAIQDKAWENSLPNIQALGMLALYQVRCGREKEAWECAVAFASGITDLCGIASQTDGEHEAQYMNACTTTYCGAVTLVRVLQLATGLLFESPDLPIIPGSLDLDQSLCSTGDTNQGNSSPKLNMYGLQPNDAQAIATRIFQLTEWVYKLIRTTQTAKQVASADLIATYAKCLDWYNSSFAMIHAKGNRTPFAIFMHMFYHFCLLCMFRSFLGVVLEGSSIRPRDLCMQSAQSILALAQSYDDMFTLRQVPGLMPYLICTAGLFSLAIEDVGLGMDLVHLRVGHNASQLQRSQPGESSSSEGKKDHLDVPPHVKMSAASHARLLLVKLRSTYPAAAVGERMLQEAMLARDVMSEL